MAATTFSYSCPTQVRFGAGGHLRLAETLAHSAKHVVLVTGRSGTASEPVLKLLTSAGLTVSQIRCAGEPTTVSIDAALRQGGGLKPDAVIACGGGAALDTGKVIRLALSLNLRSYDALATLPAAVLGTPAVLPLIALPTTAGTGAEVTANAVIGIPEKAAKISLRGRALFPDVAIIDPDLMHDAPASVVLGAGLDAVTQIFESYTSNAATPFSDALTASVKSKGLPALKRIIENGDTSGWTDLAWASHVSGLALANSGLGAAHGLASVIGGGFDAPHGSLCGRLLIPVLRRNLACAADRSDVQARIMSCITDVTDVFAPTTVNDPLSGFAAWLDANGLPRLSDWSVTPDDLPALAAAGMAASSSQKNAVPLAVGDYLQVLQDAL